MTGSPLPFSIGLTGSQLVDAALRPDLTALLDNAGAAFLVAGADRLVADSEQDARVLESTVAATDLALRAPHAAVLAAVSIQRDHPYNLARRSASSDHVTRGRSGLLLGLGDAFAPHEEVPTAWGSAGLGTGAPLNADTLRDAALAIGKLWQSWPVEAIVADRGTRIFAKADEILRIDHHGIYSIAGPLNVPSTPQRAPILAGYVHDIDEWNSVSSVVEVIVVSARLAESGALDSIASVRSEELRPLVFVEVQVSSDTAQSATRLARTIAKVSAGVTADGVHLVADSAGRILERLVAELISELVRQQVLRTSPVVGTARERLGLGAPEPLLIDARAAFAAPTAEAL